ncbi:MAG: hypothetical protein JWP45_2894 [Mucilaginibacter sp.]|nr:hypothetical protein [Mucilaginibacter sp.]
MKKNLLPLVILCLFSLFLLKCKNAAKSNEASVLADTSFTINFNPFPPTDLDTCSDAKKLSEFAWEVFLALNWRSSFSLNGKRDYPDTTWSYKDTSAAYPDLDVWETFAHRTELRPYSDKMLPFNTPPHYSFGDVLKPANASASFTLFNNLDENNEIGSCDMYAQVNLYQKQYQVLYEAKVNSEEYNYVLNNYPTKASLLQATTNTQQNIAKYKAYYPNTSQIANDNSTCDCPAAAKVICLPCGNGKNTGTMEIKAAWRRLTPKDTASKFFTRNVIYYTKAPDGSIVYNNTTYGLIALHIIHKTKNYPDFIFATFEHVDVQLDSMGYVLLDKKGNETGKLRTPTRDPIRSVTEASTNYVHNKLAHNSIWRNYRLVGVQAKPTNDSTSTATNFFLSNYVVESDSTLSHFNGSGIGTPHNHGNNLLYHGKFYSMGGCQGCHGVAQKTLGTDFSFLLDTVGKPVKAPDIGIRNNIGKMVRFIREVQLAQKKQLTANSH